MEMGKIPLEKVFGFIAGIVPGSAAIYIYYLANPASFRPFLVTSSLGYSTKLAVALGLSFVIGNSLSSFCSAFGGAVGGAFGAVKGMKSPTWPSVPETAPWRDPQWRKLAARYLGDHAPKDTRPMPDSVFQAESQALTTRPEPEQSLGLARLLDSRLSLASDDWDWMQWYRQLDRQRKAQERPDTTEYIGGGLRSNLQVNRALPNSKHDLCPRNTKLDLRLLQHVLGNIYGH